MKEIGSFIELELSGNNEYYNEYSVGGNEIIRLNTARAAIFHAVKCYGVNKVYVPIYECDTVADFLKRKGIEVVYFGINKDFTPLIETNEKASAIVFVNYYGIFSRNFFKKIIKGYNNVIIDNAQSFFSKPLENCISVYSCRKFIGVPDGSYVIGKKVNQFTYKKDYSSDTAQFLLLRTEYGCEGKAYETRKLNEQRINTSDIRTMSDLTKRLLCSYNYDRNIEIRKTNFNYAQKLFKSINVLNIDNYYDDECVPMVYPLLIEKDIIQILKDNKIFQGHWWEYLVNITEKESFEHQLSSYIIPITIDQRYSEEDIDYQYKIIKENI